jgi:folate-dependent tRNA-U54 methylase TrmFO/GidA
MLVIYRHGAYFVALGVDAIILSQLLDLRLKIAHENKTLTKYVLFQFRGGESKLSELLNEVGFQTTFKLYPPTI